MPDPQLGIAHSRSDANAARQTKSVRHTTSSNSISCSSPADLHNSKSDTQCRCFHRPAKLEGQAQALRSRQGQPAADRETGLTPVPQYHLYYPRASHPLFPGPAWVQDPVQVHSAVDLRAGAYPVFQSAVQEYSPPAQAYGLPYSHTPAAPLHDFGLGPEPLFGWEGVMPLTHTYGQPKHWRFTKPDYRRFCYSVGKADVPIARKWAGPLGPMLVPAVTGWGA